MTPWPPSNVVCPVNDAISSRVVLPRILELAAGQERRDPVVFFAEPRQHAPGCRRDSASARCSIAAYCRLRRSSVVSLRCRRRTPADRSFASTAPDSLLEVIVALRNVAPSCTSWAMAILPFQSVERISSSGSSGSSSDGSTETGGAANASTANEPPPSVATAVFVRRHDEAVGRQVERDVQLLADRRTPIFPVTSEGP